MGLCSGVCTNKAHLNQQLIPDSKVSNARRTDTTFRDQTITSFQNAILAGNESLALFLLDENPKLDLINAVQVQNSTTPLMIAVQSKQLNMVQFVLENSAKVNEQNDIGQTALHIATANGDLEAVQLLCKHGVDKSIINDQGETALMIALYNDGKEFRSIASAIEPDKAKLKKQKTKEKLRESGMTSNKLASFADDILLLSPSSAKKDENESLNRTLFTSHLTGVVDDLFADIVEDVEETAKQLPPLQSWLEKKQASPPYSWQRRWVVVVDGFMLWADREITDYAQPLTEKEKLRWSTVISLTKVETIEKVIDKKEAKDRKFTLKLKNQNRDYIFRCDTQKTRDYWVDSLRGHLQLVEKASMYNISASPPPLGKGIKSYSTSYSRAASTSSPGT
eukprot:CAMPEP_0202693376 /NCGR_PEP_ID=MMETSP1385-20130828/7512_1 /ASSEMBLY_ACC=CAM_ASM_000861 /TAXON_ID=933848 /ORGANISM="Elphidium margaritaceum" /LENGTH=393 /DNA_ID=CAMNT_0049349047 /DNA_START=52 /DNA_END=1233 /DNA_ORIENTATION=+